MTDTFTVRAVVLLLGIFASVGLAGLIFLIYTGTTSADLAIVSSPVATALGALAAVLVSTRSAPAAALPVGEQPLDLDPVAPVGKHLAPPPAVAAPAAPVVG